MPPLKIIVHTLISRFLLIIVLAICLIPAIIFLLIPTRWRVDSRAYYLFMDFFYHASLWVTFLPIQVRGAENIPQSPVIIAANHQSSLDIPLIGRLVHRFPHIWLAKKELTESILLRFILPRFTVLIDMSSPMKGMRSLINALNMVNNGQRRHAIIFPEGTRYTDGEVHEFFSGFVILAKQTGRPVIPVRIYNANTVYPPETFWINPHPIKLIVGQPMMMEENETDEQFKDRVYAWFLEQKED